jgi:hypothetical protein
MVSGAGTFLSGSTNTVTATANSGFIFTNWTQGGAVVSTSSNYTFVLASNVALVANFLPLYTISLSASPTNGGTVGGAGTFLSGSTNTVTATANSGFILTNWTQGGAVVSMSSNYTFTLASNVALVANFLALGPPTLFISQSNGMTFLFWLSSVTNFSLESTTNLCPAAWAVVTNVPALSGGYFVVSNAWPDLARYFQLVSPTYTITVCAAPGNGGTVSGGGTFAAGSSNTVTALANAGFIFTNWTAGGIAQSTASNYTFILTTNVTLVGNFLGTGLPWLSITQSNGLTYLSWTNSVTNYALETATNLPPTWVVLTNSATPSGGILTVSNAWMDPMRFFQLISP